MQRGWTRAERGALAALAALLLASLPFTVHPWYDPTNDGSMYLLTARSLLAGEGYAYLGEPFRLRPPGFPALLVPVLALFGTSFAALNAYVSLWGVATALLLFAFLRPRTGWPTALALALAVWVNPGFQRLCNQVMSDVPSAALFLACLLLERRLRARGGGWRGEVALGLAIGLASYVRTVNVLLVPAIALARLAAREPALPWLAFARSRLVLLVAVPALVLLPWSLRQRATDDGAAVDQNVLHSYSTAMWHVDPGDPSSERRPLAAIAGRVPERLEQIADVLGGRLATVLVDAPKEYVPSAADWTVFAALAVGGLLALARRRAPAEPFAFGALALYSVYFGFDDRLLLPVWLVLLPDAVLAVQVGARRIGGVRAATVTGVAVAAVVASIDARPRAGWDRIEASHAAYRQVADDVEAVVPRDARLATAIGWHLSVHLGRPVWSFHFAARRPRNGAPTGFPGIEAVLAKYGVTKVALSGLLPADRQYLEGFDRRWGLRERVGSVHVFDVR